MAPRYIIHIGPLKTASTYLQECLTAARLDLEREGVCYPEEFIAESNKFMHMPVYYALMRGKAETLRPTFEKLNASGHHTIVLSCEHFIFLKPEAFEALRDVTGASDIQVVYVARRWSDRVSSLWNQMLFMGGALSLPEFYLALLAGEAPNYYPKWLKESGAAADLDYSISWRVIESVFGRQGLSIFPYSAIMDRGEDVYERFCIDVLGLKQAPKTAMAGQKRWASMSTQDQEVLRGLNQLHLRATAEEQPAIRAQFMRRRKQFDTTRIATAMEPDIASLVVDDRNVQFDAPFNNMSSYIDRVVGSDVLFERRAKTAKYVRPGYLLGEGVRDEFLTLYDQITSAVAAAAEGGGKRGERGERRKGKVA